MRSSVYNLKKVVWTLFGLKFKHGMNRPKIHLLDHLLGHIEYLGTVLSEFPYEQFKFLVKQKYENSSKQLQTRAK